jgi:UDP-2,3-diacylglucosamine hydrolase
VHRLFISDLHLSDDTPEIESALKALLEAQPLPDALIILGDLFEAWIGDDDDSSLASRIKALLSGVADGGCEVMLARGNRDFILGSRFADEVGATLLGDETVMEVADHPTLLMHGDTLCTDDTDYQQFRALVHNPDWQQEMMNKPLDERRQLARQLRAMSADAASNKPEDIMDVNEEAVRDRMAAHSVKYLVHGHTHRPARHAMSAGERVVLGDWTRDKGWVLRERDKTLTLESFAIR